MPGAAACANAQGQRELDHTRGTRGFQWNWSIKGQRRGKRSDRGSTGKARAMEETRQETWSDSDSEDPL